MEAQFADTEAKLREAQEQPARAQGLEAALTAAAAQAEGLRSSLARDLRARRLRAELASLKARLVDMETHVRGSRDARPAPELEAELAAA